MKRFAFALLAASTALTAAPALADPLAPGTTGVQFTTFNAAERGTLLGTASTTLEGSGANTYTGFMRSAVYQNIFGTLDFYFQVAVTTINAGDEVNGLSATSFAGYLVNAFVDRTAFGIFAAAANPNSDPAEPNAFTSTAERNGGVGGVVRVNFGANGLEPAAQGGTVGTPQASNQTSATYIFRTSAASFAANGGTFTVQDGSVAQRPNFAPIGPSVPEPATWGMMILGFGVAGAAMRRRTTTKVSFA